MFAGVIKVPIGGAIRVPSHTLILSQIRDIQGTYGCLSVYREIDKGEQLKTAVGRQMGDKPISPR